MQMTMILACIRPVISFSNHPIITSCSSTNLGCLILRGTLRLRPYERLLESISQRPHSPPCPYREGNILILTLNDDAAHSLEVEITRLFEPSTLSSVMEVDVLHSSEPAPTDYPKHAVLKLYDRRYATQLRGDYNIGPWTPAAEERYREFVASGEAAKLISETEDITIDDELSWGETHEETFLFDYCRDIYRCEIDVYRRLKDLQGETIPKVFADVRFNPWPSSDPPPTDTQDFFEVPGILMEHIRGYSLGEIKDRAPPSTWQPICEEAIRIVNLIGDLGILNKDIQTRNILVRENKKGEAPSSYEVIFIDFGNCRFRGPDQSEEDWRHEKSEMDEEGAIGCVMEHKLKGGFKYQRTSHFDCSCRICREPSSIGEPATA